MNSKVHYLDPDTLDAVWFHWNQMEDNDIQWLGKYSHAYTSRKGLRSKRFENYLWEHGASIVQIDHRRKLLFRDAASKTWFLMKHNLSY